MSNFVLNRFAFIVMSVFFSLSVVSEKCEAMDHTAERSDFDCLVSWAKENPKVSIPMTVVGGVVVVCVFCPELIVTSAIMAGGFVGGCAGKYLGEWFADCMKWSKNTKRVAGLIGGFIGGLAGGFLMSELIGLDRICATTCEKKLLDWL